MSRKTTTLMLDNAECTGGAARTVENALRDVPGVLRAYVNQATEAAYVEYDTDRCSEADIDAAVDSARVHAPQSPMPRRAAAVPYRFSSERLPMNKTLVRSRTWWAFAGFVAIAAYFLTTEHRAHVFGVLPFFFLSACLLLHMFGHGGHGGHQHSPGATPDDLRNSP
jgi:cation transport ATPase